MAVPKRPTMMDPPVETLLDKVDSKFSLVTLAAKRGRQINSYFNQLGEGLGAIVPPQVASVSRKPLSIALEEIAAGKIVFVPAPDEDEVDLTAVEGEGGSDAVADLTADPSADADAAALGDLSPDGDSPAAG